MGILETLGLRNTQPVTMAVENSETTKLREEVQTGQLNLDRAMETIADLARDNAGWASIGADLDHEPSRETLASNANLVRGFSGMNPLMVRAKHIRSAYVWGAGVEVSARDGGQDTSHQDVAAVVTDYMEAPGNQVVFGELSRAELEQDLFDDGNVLIGHWVDPLDGQVSVRTVPFDEVVDIHTAPGDKSTPWFYLRQWSETFTDGRTRQYAAWYPDLDYQPAAKIRALDGKPVLWPGKTETVNGARMSGAAIYHLRVNPAGRSKKWGVGDGFPALPWAKAYNGFLSDCAKLYGSLAKIAHVVSGSKDKTQSARATASAMGGPAGGALHGDNVQVDTPSFSGINPAAGRPFASMVASATGVSVTILTADPGQEGARAVAETLDKPMRLALESRQRLWAQFYRASCGYAIEQAVQAPRGPLRGRLQQAGSRKTVAFTDDTDPTVEVTFPPIEDENLTTTIEAVVKADATGKLPPLETLRLILRAFEIEGADDILDRYTSDDGEWIDPLAVADTAAGNAAAQLLRQGGNPTEVL